VIDTPYRSVHSVGIDLKELGCQLFEIWSWVGNLNPIFTQKIDAYYHKKAVL